MASLQQGPGSMLICWSSWCTVDMLMLLMVTAIHWCIALTSLPIDLATATKFKVCWIISTTRSATCKQLSAFASNSSTRARPPLFHWPFLLWTSAHDSKQVEASTWPDLHRLARQKIFCIFQAALPQTRGQHCSRSTGKSTSGDFSDGQTCDLNFS